MPEQIPIGIRELIDEVKRELLEPHTDPMFLVGHVDLEVSFTVERDMNGKLKLQILEAGADKKSIAAQVVKIALEPIYTVEQIRQKLKDTPGGFELDGLQQMQLRLSPYVQAKGVVSAEKSGMSRRSSSRSTTHTRGTSAGRK